MAGAAAATTSALVAQSDRDLDFLAREVDGRHLKESLRRHLHEKVVRLLDDRKRRIQAIRSTADLQERQRYVREKLQSYLGEWPERSPLNAEVTGLVDRGTYRIEKIVFESMPGFRVTANLYLPPGHGPFPAILFPLGHEAGGKSYPVWQQLLGSFAQKGYVALAWDPLGQGERVQIWDDDWNESKVVRSTSEHTMMGLQTLLLGESLARYTIWDGIRALDYLASRPEVDAKRIGVTGNSGGGTHTAYMAALDDRLQVAAPSCYLTNWRRLTETIGPQDAEQCMPPFLADGLDHPDFILAFGLKPYRILSAIRDFFSIEGARETYAEARSVYDRLGAADKIGMTEADDGHGYSEPRRMAAYDWFSRWLKGEPDTRPEPDVKIAHEEELWATKTGQVATSHEGETVTSLNQKRLAEIRRGPITAESVREFLGVDPSGEPARVRSYGAAQAGGGYRLEKLLIESEPGIPVPALLYLPEGGGSRPGIVYVNGRGKSVAHAEAESLVRAGIATLSIDARGLGETRAIGERNGSDWPRLFGDFESTMLAMLTGKSLVAMRAEDVMRAVGVLAARAEVDTNRLAVVGREGGAISALHAAVLDRRVKGAGVDRMVVSYASIVRRRVHRQQYEDAIVGVLRKYDLPDLLRLAVARGPAVVADVLDPVGQLLPLSRVSRAYAGAAQDGNSLQRASRSSSTRTARRPSWRSTSGTTSARRTRSPARPASRTCSST
jgi:cephalosporin-C deacetylase-like acetyl esterase